MTIPPLGVIVAVVLFIALAVVEIGFKHWMPDLFIYRAGAQIALHGQSPYDTVRIQERVGEHFPGEEHTSEHCGFFLPPLAIPLFAPFSLLNWKVAQILFAILSLLAGLACMRLAREAPFWVATVVLINFPAFMNLLLGQLSIITVGCIVAGPMLLSHSPRLAMGFWAIAFIKPHVALPLLILACLQSRRHAMWLVIHLLLLTLLAMLLNRSIMLPLDFLTYLSSGGADVLVNRVGIDPQMTSWNVTLWAAGGPAINLGLIGTLGSYAVWFMILGWRCGGRKPDLDWQFAAAAVGALLCCQVHVYEVFVLVLALPLALRPQRLNLFAVVLILHALPLEHVLPTLPPWRCWLTLMSAGLLLRIPPIKP